MAGISANELFRVFLPTTFRSSERTIVVSQASSVKGACGLRDQRMIRSPKPVLYDAMGSSGPEEANTVLGGKAIGLRNQLILPCEARQSFVIYGVQETLTLLFMIS